MKTAQWLFLKSWSNTQADANFLGQEANLALVFGSRLLLTQKEHYDYIRNLMPNAQLVFCSTSGEILNDAVYDQSISVTGITFEKSTVQAFKTNINEHSNSYDAGRFLFNQIPKDDLTHVLIFSDGTLINGSELVDGLNADNAKCIAITGGLAGDGDQFKETVTGLNQIPTSGEIIAIGLYGSSLEVSHGFQGGWNEFGHEKQITKSNKNVLYEIDGESALDLYKQYLGDYSKELPGSALLFPISLKMPGSDTPVVRTILSIDENQKSMTFAGNMPEGSTVRLMKANFDKLIDAAGTAAKNSTETMTDKPQLALLISCVGRKLLLNERADDEVESSRDFFGDNTSVAGFYSYGEICPFTFLSKCELHNQTMTITTFTEA